MRSFLLFLINGWCLSIIAQAPIILGNANMPGNGDTLRYTVFQVGSAGNYTQTGVNFTWDFSQVISITEGVRSFKNGLQTPYTFFFGLTGYGEKIMDSLPIGPLVVKDYYNFYKKQTTPTAAFIADGLGMTFNGIPIPNYYSDKDELYVFPLTYPQHDSTTFKFSSSVAGIIPVNYSKEGYRITTVDGWGTVITPYGSESCLRLVTTQYANDSIKNSLLPIPVGFQNYQRSYQWLTLNSKIPYLEITGTLTGDNFIPAQARYRGYKPQVVVDPVGITEEHAASFIKIYPNPSKEELNFVGEMTHQSSYEIYGLDGKLQKALQPVSGNAGGVTLSISHLEPGIYFIKAKHNKEEKLYKFIKE